MKRVKCVNLGLPKSGTTTLAHALTEAGWLAADHKVRRAQSTKPGLAGTYIGHQLFKGHFNSGNPFEFLDLYDALTEINALNGPVSIWPQCDYALIKSMRMARPDLSFVATWRSPEDMADSMRRWNNLGVDRLPNGTMPGMPHGFGKTDAELITWIEGHYDMLRDLFGDDPRYLELDVTADDAPDKLGGHLGIEVPWWGKKNVNSETPGAKTD